MDRARFVMSESGLLHGHTVTRDGRAGIEFCSMASAFESVCRWVEAGFVEEEDVWVVFRDIHTSGMPLRIKDADPEAMKVANLMNEALAATLAAQGVGFAEEAYDLVMQ